MRRIALVLVVGALIAAMLGSAGPAKADVTNIGNTGSFYNQEFVVITDDESGDDWWAGRGWFDGRDIDCSSGDITFETNF